MDPARRTVAVIGASNDRRKFGNRAVRAYRAEGWIVYPVHPHAAAIEGIPACRSVLDVPGPVDRATVYLHPETVLGVLDEIARKGVRELYLNPGSESHEVIARAEALGLLPILACSIVEIGRSPANPEG
jgi:hypothetical protein